MTETPPKRRMVRPPAAALAPHRLSERLKTTKNRSQSSQAWLERQINDPFAAAARANGYRSRAAFKLIQLDERFHLLTPRTRLVDLGCAPGGWLQVALHRPVSEVVGIDLLPAEPLAGAAVLQGDFTDPSSHARVIERLSGPPNLVLSDLAPNTTGHRRTDHLRILGLVEAAADLAMAELTIGGAFVAKAFQGGETGPLLARLKVAFHSVRHAKPKASRVESAEVYLVAQGFRGRGPAT